MDWNQHFKDVSANRFECSDDLLISGSSDFGANLSTFGADPSSPATQFQQVVTNLMLCGIFIVSVVIWLAIVAA